MKTPEELAEEWCAEHTCHLQMTCHANAFLAGYKAAQPKWISVKERLPSCGVLCAWISDTTQSCIARIEVDDMHPWYEGFDYWCELPEPPKEEK